MTRLLKNPTRREFEAFIRKTQHGQVRGIIDSRDGTIFLADATDGLHFRMAHEAGVEDYSSFIITRAFDEFDQEDFDYNLDAYYVFMQLRFLHQFRVQMPVVGIRLPTKLAA